MASKNEIKVILTADSSNLEAKTKSATAAIKTVGPAGQTASAGLNAMKVAALGSIAGLTLLAGKAVKDVAMMNARYETLGVVMNVVGRNAGYSAKEMAGFTLELQKNGIAMIESRSAVTKMAAAHLDVSKSAELARIAQDAAVIGNINSSESFDRMITGIQTMNPMILRAIGLEVQFGAAEDKLAKSLGKTSDSLSVSEKMLARTNAVMEAGTSIAGTYEASMGTAGKMMGSLTRYTDNLATRLGTLFGPALTLLVEEYTEALKEAEKATKDNDAAVKGWGLTLRNVLVDVQRGTLEDAETLNTFFADVERGWDRITYWIAIQTVEIKTIWSATINDLTNTYASFLDLVADGYDLIPGMKGAAFDKRVAAASMMKPVDAAVKARDAEVARLKAAHVRQMAILDDVEAQGKQEHADKLAALNDKIALLDAPVISAEKVKRKLEVAGATDAETTAKEKAAKAAEKAAAQSAKAYEATLDKLMPLRVEQREYNEALAALDQMDPSHATAEYTIALGRLNAGTTAAIERQRQLADDIQWVKAATASYREVVISTMSEEEQAVISVTDSYRDKQAAVVDMMTAGLDAAEAAKMSIKLTAMEAVEQERLAKNEEAERIRKRREERDKDIESLKKSSSVLAGFTAGVMDLQDNMHTLGQVGADAFTAISGGVTASISTSLKYMAHGLSDAKELLAESRDDSIAAADQANQEMLADLERSFAEGTISAEDYEKKKTGILENYTKSRQRIQEDYNKGVIEAEKKLGKDIGNIWTGVLDSMLDSVAQWMSDLAIEFIMKDIAAPALSSLGLNIDGLLSGPKGSAGDPFFVNVLNGGVGGGDGKFVNQAGQAVSMAEALADTASLISNASATFSTSADYMASDAGWGSAATEQLYGKDYASSWDSAAISNSFWSGTAATGLENSLATASSALTDSSSALLNTSQSMADFDRKLNIEYGALPENYKAANTVSDFLTEVKPYLQGASAVMAGYSAYNQFKSGDEVGGSVSAIGSASSLAQAGQSAGLYNMGATGAGVVGAAGVVGSAYGLYKGIDSMLEDGVTLQNGISTALSAYSMYTSASAAYVGMTGGTAFTGAGALGPAIVDAITAAGTYVSGLAGGAGGGTGGVVGGTVGATGGTVGGTSGVVGGATGGATGGAVGGGSGAATGTAGAVGGVVGGVVAAGVVFMASKVAETIIDNMQTKGNHEQLLTTSNGGAWEYAKNLDNNMGNLHGIIEGSARAAFDRIQDSVPTAQAIEGFRGGIDVLTNSFNTGSAELYRALESGAISYEQYVEKVAGKDVAGEKAAEMQALASQAAQGSIEALAALKTKLVEVGVEGYAAAEAAVAMTSAAEAQTSGFVTSTSGLQALMQTADLWIDKVALQDVAFEKSMAMHATAVEVLATRNKESFASLEKDFEALGMSEEKATDSALRMIEAVDQGGAGFAAMTTAVTDNVAFMGELTGRTLADIQQGLVADLAATSAAMEVIGDTYDVSEGAEHFAAVMTKAAEDYAYALKTVGKIAADSVHPLGSLAYSLQELAGFDAYGMANAFNSLYHAAQPPAPLVQQYASGGVVGGLLQGGSGRVDDLYMGTVNGRTQIAMGGEYFMPPAQTQKHLPLLEAIRADKFSIGGLVAGVIGANGARTTVTAASVAALPPMIGSALSELAKIMQPIRAIVAGTQEYGLALQDLKNQYRETYDKAKEAKASEADLILIRKAQVVELAALAAAHKQETAGMLTPYRQLSAGMTDYRISLADLAVKYKEALQTGRDLGLSEAQLNVIRQAQTVETTRLTADHGRAVVDMLTPYRQLNAGMSDYRIGLADLKTKYAAALLAGRDLGLSESQLKEIRMAQGVETRQYAEDLKKPFLESARELIATNGMTDYQKQMREINERYTEGIITMREAGATIGEVTTMDKARAIELAKLKRGSLNENDYATRVDYERALYHLPSFAVGTDYVPRDMVAMIHQGERITPAKYNQRADESVADLKNEIKLLRAELKAQNEANLRNTGIMARIFDQWEHDGMPEVRTA